MILSLLYCFPNILTASSLYKVTTIVDNAIHTGKAMLEYLVRLLVEVPVRVEELSDRLLPVRRRSLQIVLLVVAQASQRLAYKRPVVAPRY